MCYDITDMSDDDFERRLCLIGKENQNKISRYRNEDDKKRSVAGYILVQDAVSKKLGIPKEKIIIKTDTNGKPYIASCPLRFNISHSADLTVCAVSESEIGIDIEKIRPVNLQLTKKFCTDRELKYIFANISPADLFELKKEDVPTDILVRFFEIWTAKEAVVKLIGTGIKEGLLSFEVIADNGCLKSKNFKLEHISVNKDYICTIAHK